MAEAALFESIIEGISNDKFLVFIEQYTHALISPLSIKHLKWCSELDEDVDDDNEAAVSPPGSSAALQPSSIFHYSTRHFEVFQMYQLMFETRIVSVLKASDHGSMTPERFFELCASIVAEDKSAKVMAMATNLETVDIGGDEGKSAEDASQRPITAADLCNALLDMVETISSFDAFAELMAKRQRQLIAVDNDETASSSSTDGER